MIMMIYFITIVSFSYYNYQKWFLGVTENGLTNILKIKICVYNCQYSFRTKERTCKLVCVFILHMHIPNALASKTYTYLDYQRCFNIVKHEVVWQNYCS